ncbi:hypothetical protein TRFO_21548 [Tritrichomonas foetus]|uniref:EF-hand domain-containing protein n=1 Tax=Tritrichomonas foetus TaxID=1144522 RepID=A0A1J4KF69_9EUKA|nr:hypothetical protein TRFO_21548 [Tritrichomonas foetus]|eukprot:OHT09576.1 hypothetical protein TRFO_21548 [Tritrichomonas foetus]
MADEEPAEAPTEEQEETPEEPAEPAEPVNPYARLAEIDTRTPMQKALQAIPRTKEDNRDLFWSDILAFYQVFGKNLEGEELQAFQKKYNPENKISLPQDRALPALTEFIGKDDFILMLQSESKVLDPKHEGTVHHAEDFRMMLKELGDDIGDDLVNDFIREALGRNDDEFDINVYLQFMCQETHYTEEIKKSKVGR